MMDSKNLDSIDVMVESKLGSSRRLAGAFSFVPLSEFVGRPSWTKSGP